MSNNNIMTEKEKYIEEAKAQFEKVLREQIKRAELMAQGASKKDFASLETITIGLIDGDGIGPIIMKQATRVLEALLKDEIASGKIVLKRIEGLTIENRLAKKQPVPEDVLKAIKECDVILKGPTTTPKGGTMESANVTLRRELDLYSNIRPVVIPDEGIDWMFFRENTEGEYVLGSKGIEIPDTLSIDFKVTTVEGTKRIAKAAFDYARANGKTSVSIITKANIMKKTDGSFSKICHEVSEDYPEIKVDEYYIDIMTANLVNKSIRNQFQVFLLPNLYGDIITDEAAEIQGGVGTAGSANTGDRYAMFEAIHGSAPRMIEDGLGDYANPSSIIKASEMMLRHIGMTAKADILFNALKICCDTEKSVVVTGAKDGVTAKEFGDYILSKLK